MEQKKRLQKYLSSIGFCSRRKAEKLILENIVKVNGRIAVLGDKLDPNKDIITINGEKVKNSNEKKYYIMLNKPRGWVTTLSDEKNRKCVADLVKNVGTRVYPIGRLDKNSEGLLLLTNDGDFANKIMHPSKEILKTYRVTVHEKVTEKIIENFSLGIEIDNKKTLPAQVKLILEELERSVLEISISEGKNRQIRKMCESQGLTVVRLKRVKIGGLKLGMLAPGKWKELSKEEISKIF